MALRISYNLDDITNVGGQVLMKGEDYGGKVLDNIYRPGKGDALTWWFYLCCDMRRKYVIRKVLLGGIEESMI